MRYVRTAEGAAKYKRPIGSVISTSSDGAVINPRGLTRDDGETFGADYWGDVEDDLTPDQIEAVGRYTQFEYRDINAVLRGDDPSVPEWMIDSMPDPDPDDDDWDYDTEVDKLREQYADEMRTVADHVQDAIDEAPPVPEDITVTRWINANAFGDEFASRLRAGDHSVAGSTFEEPGFTSTTLQSDPSSFRTDAEFLLELHVPEGTPALYVSAGLSTAEVSENELLFGQRTRFTVNGVRELPDHPGKFVVEGILV